MRHVGSLFSALSHSLSFLLSTDCREGLLVAVEKGRYESVEQGVHLAVDVYIKALQVEQAKKDLRIYVHPITPGQ